MFANLVARYRSFGMMHVTRMCTYILEKLQEALHLKSIPPFSRRQRNLQQQRMANSPVVPLKALKRITTMHYRIEYKRSPWMK